MDAEVYLHEGEGYNPFLIRPGWQVAQLGYAANLGYGEGGLKNVERHAATDEVFVLQHGQATLVTAALVEDTMRFRALSMEKNKVYNIPAGVWHTIAVSRDCLVLIVEKDGTHLGDVEYHWLDAPETAAIRTAVNA